MSHEFAEDAIAGATVASALIVAEHVALWPWRGRVPQLGLYVLGTLAIGAGGARFLARQQAPLRTIGGLAIIVAATGLTTGILHGWRALQHRQERRAHPWPLEAMELPPLNTPPRRRS